VRIGRLRSSKVDDFGTNRKRVCDFLLVRQCDYGPILHRFWDTATYWLKIAYFSYPSLIRHPHSLCYLWNFVLKLTMRKPQSWGYPPVKTSMIVAWVVLAWYQRMTDGQTDRRTESIIANTAVSYADALQKWVTLTHMIDKKLSYRRATARQLPTWREGGAKPSSPLWLHLCVWLNPKGTTYVRQACRPVSAL